ncbi:hypothetical protein ACMGGR_19885 [Erwinia sp. BNK-24-b]|uniref:hypothetical protein n=1 Tax=unclassified Erwinia TaxID=2622719 RepID=UPI0039BEFBF6
MRIACLGWGSLIWKPGVLPVAGEWKQDGPRLPIEFSRISDGGELATAICLNADPVPVFWAWLDVDNLSTAIQLLKQREAIPAERNDGIGSLKVTDTSAGLLAEWAKARNIDALIWTALPPRNDHVENCIPPIEQAVAYLTALQGETREHARDYIQRVPTQIDTAYRRIIVESLGWQS